MLIQSINRALAGWANYFRHGVSKAVFSKIDDHAWNRIMRWLRRKYHTRRSGIGMPELRRRFCVPGTWTFAYNGVRFTGASAVPVTRYRYRGSTIPTPFTPQPEAAPLTSGQGTRRARAVKPHGGFGGRAGLSPEFSRTEGPSAGTGGC